MAERRAVAMSPQRFKPYPSYRDSGVEWLGQIPAHWETRRLRSTVTSCQNGIWGGEPDGIRDVACIRVADFDRVSFKVEIRDPTLRAIDTGVVEERGLRPGDLLLEKSGGGENQLVGAVVLFDHDIPAVCSNFIARVVIAKDQFPRYQTYLHAALYSRRINIRHIKQSTGIQNLDSSSYFGEAVGLPPKPEQRAIASFLDRETARIDALVAKKERLIQLLQEKRTALITRAVTKGLDPTVPLKDSGVEWLGEIPAHWEVKQLGKAMEILMDFRGRTPMKLGMDWGGDIPALSAINVRNGFIDLSRGVNYGSQALHDRWMTQGSTKKGDVLFTTEAPLGNVALVPDDNQYILSQRVVLLRPRPDQLTPEYLQRFLISSAFRHAVELQATGSTAEGIKRRHLMSTAICTPQLGEQWTIAAFLDQEAASIDTLIDKVREAIDRLKELRTALISTAVTGKIDVREETS
jgi:type I restriction enzyme, S subunit